MHPKACADQVCITPKEAASLAVYEYHLRQNIEVLAGCPLVTQ